MHTNRRARVLIAIVTLCVIAPAVARPAPAQEPQKKEAAATVSGRVSVDGRGAAGVQVALMPAESAGPARRVVARARTDSEGDYKLTGIAPGRYRVLPVAPAYVVGELRRDDWAAAAFLMLGAGETVEDVDFTLARGGVITGRVTDADGRAVVGENVNVMPLDPTPGAQPSFGQLWRQTDDRGVYRVYGLRAGRYRVFVGVDPSNSYSGLGSRPRGYYVRTFHPDATDEARARVVEVTEGGEAGGVDIALGALMKTFRVSGRVVNAATGQAAGGVRASYGVIERDGRHFGGGMIVQANARGEFLFEGVAPGRYGAHSPSEGPSEFFSDVAVFEVTDSDVTGVEVKLHAGSSLSGVVAVEGLADGALAAPLLRGLSLIAGHDSRRGVVEPGREPVRVSPDGGFRMSGLPPGRMNIQAGYPPVKGLSLARVELNGVELRGGIEVAEGSHVAGVRVVFTYGSGRVRGQVLFRAGGQEAALPPQTRIMVIARRPGGGGRPLSPRPAEVDSRGRFLVEGLPAGEVELHVNAFGPKAGAQVRQLVNVTDGAETSVTLTLDLDQPPPPPPPRRPPGER